VILQRRVLGAEVVPPDDAAIAQARVDPGRGHGAAHRELVEEAARPHREARKLGDAGRRVVRIVPAQLRDAAESPGAQRGEVDGRGEGHQRFVGADVRGRLLAPDVLLARVEREDVAANALAVAGLARDASARPAYVLALEGEEAQVGSAEAGRAPERLPFPRHHVRAAASGRLEQSERDRVGHDDGERPCRMGGIDERPERRGRHDPAEEIGALHHHAGGRRAAATGERRGLDADVVGEQSLSREGEPHALGVGAHHRPVLGVEAGGEEDGLPLAPPGVQRHQHRFGRGRGAGIVGGVRGVHAGEARDHGLILEDRLQRALRYFGLIGRVGGGELAPRDDRVDHRGDEVTVGAGAEEAGHRGARRVARGHRRKLAHQLELRQGRGEVEGGESSPLGHVMEELPDAADAERLAHRRPVGVRVRDGAHGRLTATPRTSGRSPRP